MKKLLFSFLLLLTAVVGRAEDFEVDGIYYNITSAEELTVEVTYKGDSYAQRDDRYSGSVEISENVTYDGVTYSVTAIGDHAFAYCKNLTSVTIPGSVVSVDVRAFNECTALTSVTIPHGVVSMGEYVFFGCSALTSVTIPNSVTT
ncbi:MAG: leucine-rich repeat domain-containing protein, partial [Bacteroidaceae bacterium]|nr:leucine-rich repeat domain-containing protein [Bacteroidaceae bacterium]